MKKNIITGIVVLAMFYMMSMSAHAVQALYSIPANQVWTGGIPIARSGEVNYVTVSLTSVYPLKGIDTFKKVQARLVNYAGDLVSASESVVLEEGKGDKNIYLDDDYAYFTLVYLELRGNSNAAAEAVINYNGN